MQILMQRFIQESLGGDFRAKVGSTFMDDVDHELWNIDKLIVQKNHGLFDWHANRNSLYLKRIEDLLHIADLPPLQNPDFPPRWVLLHFTNQQDSFNSEEEYLRNLQGFYWEQGYSIEL
ncbi:hypothetical protein MNBD_GAMMA25-972 [hydrothermal vent metagenome]|uniref:Uncharacterized protein n=1 Tax=hydrothermal vent metagenome TaxID=652676 RepID=A0A3B1BBX0_9ZZZZ